MAAAPEKIYGATPEGGRDGFPFFVAGKALTKPTAVFLHVGEIPQNLADALARIKNDPDWEYMAHAATPRVCESFQRLRFPALVLYNSAGDEVAASVGDMGVLRLIQAYF